VAELLPPLIVLKIISFKFNHYLNTVYYSKLFGLNSFFPLYFLGISCVRALRHPF
jgi:hypothetical protein